MGRTAPTLQVPPTLIDSQCPVSRGNERSLAATWVQLHFSQIVRQILSIFNNMLTRSSVSSSAASLPQLTGVLLFSSAGILHVAVQGHPRTCAVSEKQVKRLRVCCVESKLAASDV